MNVKLVKTQKKTVRRPELKRGLIWIDDDFLLIRLKKKDNDNMTD